MPEKAELRILRLTDEVNIWFIRVTGKFQRKKLYGLIRATRDV
jgi:hypothetical protein